MGNRGVRGRSYLSSPVRPAGLCRSWNEPEFWGDNVGIRLVRNVKDERSRVMDGEQNPVWYHTLYGYSYLSVSKYVCLPQRDWSLPRCGIPTVGVRLCLVRAKER